MFWRDARKRFTRSRGEAKIKKINWKRKTYLARREYKVSYLHWRPKYKRRTIRSIISSFICKFRDELGKWTGCGTVSCTTFCGECLGRYRQVPLMILNASWRRLARCWLTFDFSYTWRVAQSMINLRNA